MRRWIIRSFFIGLLLLCVGGWVWSYTGTSPLIGFARDDKPDFQYMAQLDRGTLHICRSEYCQNFPLGFFCERSAWPHPVATGSVILGFYSNPDEDEFFHWSGIPLWFPAALSAALLSLAWRVTRPRTNGPAFPVEFTNPVAEPPAKAP